MAEVKSDIEIARAAKKKPIQEIGAKLGIPTEHLLPYGHDKAKISAEFIASVKGDKDGKLILVTAINPTPAGEGKTTTTVGLGDGLNRIGKKAIVCIREASLGPNFGVKGGAAGGGYAQVVPMEDMNLHFTGDFHAITTAHNLLSALIDNHIYWGNELGIDTRRVVWRRVMDMNDRALREIICSLGGVANGFPREAGFDITVASEVMAILCLSTDLKDLEKRLGDIIVAYRRDKTPVYARDLKADGAMAVLLKDAMQPNLVQTLENNPAFVHGGPFANIAHGCNSVVATTTALKLADYVVTEAGFGADLGAEKFFDIKCRKAGLKPAAAVIVATVRAMKMNGGVKKEDLGKENVEAVKKGCANLGRHIENVKQFGVPAVVAINHFISDTDAEIAGDEGVRRLAWATRRSCASTGPRARPASRSWRTRWSSWPNPAPRSSRRSIPTTCRCSRRSTPSSSASIAARRRSPTSRCATSCKAWEDAGYGNLPVCMAKTQYSFSTDPNLRGAPTGHTVPVREVRLSAGAGFVVVICGEIMTMPGLPKAPSSEKIFLNESRPDRRPVLESFSLDNRKGAAAMRRLLCLRSGPKPRCAPMSTPRVGSAARSRRSPGRPSSRATTSFLLVATGERAEARGRVAGTDVERGQAFAGVGVDALGVQAAAAGEVALPAEDQVLGEVEIEHHGAEVAVLGDVTETTHGGRR